MARIGMRQIVAGLVVAIGALPAQACSLPGGGTVEMTAATVNISGRLDIRDVDCPFVDAAGERMYLMLPQGWTIAGRPRQLANASGEIVASNGQPVAVVGIRGDTGGTLCGPGIPLVVSVIDTAP